MIDTAREFGKELADRYAPTLRELPMIIIHDNATTRMLDGVRV